VTQAPIPFRHTDPGTPESTWLADERWDGVPVLDLTAVARRYTRVLVVAAHPDVETLGVGGLVAGLADRGVTLDVVVATDGERSHPVRDAIARDALASRRRAEVERAVARLGAGPPTHLGLPDGRLERHVDTVVDEVRARSDPDTLVLAPWLADGHADHDALGRACATAVSRSGADLAYYPIWLWHWGSPDTLPWPDVVASESSREASWRKREALQEFRSQITAWVDVGDPGTSCVPVLGTTSLERGHRLVETLLDPTRALPTVSSDRLGRRAAGRTQQLDRMYDDEGADPWQLAGSFYEERRRALVLGLLGSRRHGRALEIGCADGRLTEALLERCDDVVALDTSHRAVTAARARAPRATIVRGTAPADLPSGPFDLVLLSEVGYFLSPLELVATLRRCEAALAPGGELLLCHWQHPTRDVPLDGPLVHDQAASVLRAGHRASYVDEDLRIDVWGDGPSVARREGRT
jgi:LmbE family N-acetylglucosaminyl deacetylase/SAM-dependent methyltransferase